MRDIDQEAILDITHRAYRHGRKDAANVQWFKLFFFIVAGAFTAHALWAIIGLFLGV
jgi:hypothetical protein